MKKYIIGTDECPVKSKDDSQYFWWFTNGPNGIITSGHPEIVEVFGFGAVVVAGAFVGGRM